jgi:hypothetical protein
VNRLIYPILFALVLSAFVSISHAEYTSEQVIWWCYANLPGVACEDPTVVAFYKAQLSAPPPAYSSTVRCEYTETIVPLNETHLQINVYDCDKNKMYNELKYSKTKPITPPAEPEITVPVPAPVINPAPTSLEERIAALESKLVRLCNSGIKEAC